MRYCPSCRYEYQPKVNTCPDCGVALVEKDLVECASCEELIERSSEYCEFCGVLRDTAKSTTAMCSTHTSTRAIGRCVVCEKTVCHECAVVKNGKRFCGDDEHVRMAFDWVAVTTYSTPIDAEVARSCLESAGIPATILSHSDRMYVVNVGNLAVAELMVPKRRAEEAARILGLGASDDNPSQ